MDELICFIIFNALRNSSLVNYCCFSCSNFYVDLCHAFINGDHLMITDFYVVKVYF